MVANPDFNHRGARYLGSPGYMLESKFDNLLKSMEIDRNKKISIFMHHWASNTTKSKFDFLIRSDVKSGVFYVDVVGHHTDRGAIRLHTSHKEIPDLLEYCRKQQKKNGDSVNNFKAYLAFYMDDKWNFLRLQNGLPKGDIYLSKHRVKGVRSMESVFGINPKYEPPHDNEPRKTTESELLSSVSEPYHFVKYPGQITLKFNTDTDQWIAVMNAIKTDLEAKYGALTAYRMISDLLKDRRELIS